MYHKYMDTMEPWFNKALFTEVLEIRMVIVKHMEKNPDTGISKTIYYSCSHTLAEYNVHIKD